MLIISGATQRFFKRLKRVADYYADNQRPIRTDSEGDELSGYVFIKEELKKAVNEKEETEKSLRKEIQALVEQNKKGEQEKANIHLRANITYKNVAASRCELFECKRLAKSTLQKKENKIREMKVKIVELNSEQKQTEEQLKIE